MNSSPLWMGVFLYLAEQVKDMYRVAVVTGGSRGIGAACVEKFAAEGYCVVFFSRAETQAAQSLAQRLQAKGLNVRHMACDVSDGAAVAEAFRKIDQLYHRVDVLVNNAGISLIRQFQDTAIEDWRKLFSVNTDGVYHCIQGALPLMLRRRQGAVVNVASMWGQVGASCEAAYSATKASLIGLSMALAKELAPSGIRVNCVSPGLIDTDMNAKLSESDLAALCEEIPLGRMGTPVEVAEAVYFLASERSAYITGQLLGVNGGLVV